MDFREGGGKNNLLLRRNMEMDVSFCMTVKVVEDMLCFCSE